MGQKAKPLSRRTFLRGAGVALGLPLLEAMKSRGAAASWLCENVETYRIGSLAGDVVT